MSVDLFPTYVDNTHSLHTGCLSLALDGKQSFAMDHKLSQGDGSCIRVGHRQDEANTRGRMVQIIEVSV